MPLLIYQLATNNSLSNVTAWFPLMTTQMLTPTNKNCMPANKLVARYFTKCKSF